MSITADDSAETRTADPDRAPSARVRVQDPPPDRRHGGKSAVPLRVRWWWWRSYVLALPLVAALAGLAASYLVPARYTATARLLPPQANASSAQILAVTSGGSAGLGMSAMGAKSPSEVYAQLFYSRSVQSHAIEQLQLDKRLGIQDRDELHMALTRATVSSVTRAGLIELSVTDTDAARSAEVANALVAGMYAVGMRMTQDAARRQMAFYDQLIAETRERLRKADDDLLALEARSGLTRQKGQEEVSLSAILELKATLATRQVELARLRRSATEQQPDVQRVRAEVEALREQLAGLETPRDRARAGMMVPPAEYAQLRRLVEPARREVESLASVLQTLQRNREASRIDDSRDLSTIVVLDPAATPSMRSWPVRGRFAVSAFSGALLLSLAFAFFLVLRQGAPVKERRRPVLAAVR